MDDLRKKYAGTVRQCRLEGFKGPVNGAVIFPDSPEHDTAVVFGISETSGPIQIRVLTHLAISRCEDAVFVGQAPTFYYS